MIKNQNLYEKILDNLYEGVYIVDKNRKIIFWNKSAERITGFKNFEVLGKRCSENILIHINEKGQKMCDSKKLCPLEKTIIFGKIQEEKIYLSHKDGQRVPVFLKVFPIVNKNKKIIGAVEIFRDNSYNVLMEQKIKELEKLSLTDQLTKVGNRRFAEMNISLKIEEFKRYNLKFGILFIDIDDFKNINDIYGHNIGDKVLKMVAKTLSNNVRAFDVVCRWGGEEFIVIIENVNEKVLYSIADKLRLLVQESIIFIGNSKIQVTVSIGATLIKKNDTINKLLKRVDSLMYQSKKLGKNRVSVRFKNIK